MHWLRQIFTYYGAVLREKFDLKCTIHKHPAGPRIYIMAESMDQLRQLVLPHVVPSMHSKLWV